MRYKKVFFLENIYGWFLSLFLMFKKFLILFKGINENFGKYYVKSVFASSRYTKLSLKFNYSSLPLKKKTQTNLSIDLQEINYELLFESKEKMLKY